MKEEIANTEVQSNTIEQNRFISIDDFKDCVDRGGEIEFEWNNKDYWIVPDWAANKKNGFAIYEPNKQETEKIYSNVDKLLDHKLDGEMLRSIVMKLKVWSRTI